MAPARALPLRCRRKEERPLHATGFFSPAANAAGNARGAGPAPGLANFPGCKSPKIAAEPPPLAPVLAPFPGQRVSCCKSTPFPNRTAHGESPILFLGSPVYFFFFFPRENNNNNIIKPIPALAGEAHFPHFSAGSPTCLPSVSPQQPPAFPPRNSLRCRPAPLRPGVWPPPPRALVAEGRSPCLLRGLMPPQIQACAAFARKRNQHPARPGKPGCSPSPKWGHPAEGRGGPPSPDPALGRVTSKKRLGYG